MSKRRSVLCLLLLTFTLSMAKHLRSQSNTSPKQSSPAASQNSSRKSALKKLSPAARTWVDATMKKMSTDEKIGQLLFTTYHGTFTSADSPAYQQMLHFVNDLHAGGFIIVTHIGPLGIEKSQAYPTAALNNALQAKAKIPLLVGADFERGSAMRLDEGTSFPTQMALAAAGDAKDAYTMGK
ncbi:MAG TPA: glycoside hydrolase family 3 N-terminal domain-containing protein, partial [Candidatus Acidoferrum sp.]|nr:glycoside hydrolase family 3 N-terminal domain-containing protein [Candidatus Acidoferrum sp.]